MIPKETIQAFGVLGFPHRMPTTVTSADIKNRDIDYMYPHQIKYVEDFNITMVSMVGMRDDEKDGEHGAWRVTTNADATAS